MIQYPILFESRASATAGVVTQWEINSGQNSAICAVPKEFEGPGGGFSPEDLFAQALTNCFVATFKVFAENSRVAFEKLDVVGRLTVDRDETKRPVMKYFLLQIKLYSPSNPERAKTLVKKTVESGFILSSVKTEISYELALE
jgi:organic hydroperoxide reductase OsmC/OhrA